MNFHNIFKVYRHDWRRIAKNPIALIVVAGICVLPSLYAWVNIEACWSIYDNTNQIPVAVVNNDKDASYKGKKINVGSQIVSQLKKNNKIKWVFTNTRDADLGLVDSTYYAMIEIPSDFSSKLLTVLTDKPEKPQIIYKVDNKANPVAGKITSAANSTLVQQVTTEFVSTVNETVFSSVNQVGESAAANKEDILKMKDSIISLNRNMGVVTSSLQSMETNSGNLGDLLDSVSASMPSIQSSLQAVGKTNSDNRKILASVQSSMSKSAQNVDASLCYAQTENQKIGALLASLNDSSASAAASKANTVIPVVSAQISSMNTSIDATIDYLKQCRDYDYNTDIEKVISELQKTKTALAELRKTLVNLENEIGNAQTATDNLYQYVREHQTEIDSAIDNANSALKDTIDALQEADKIVTDPTEKQYLENAIKDLNEVYNDGKTATQLKQYVQNFLDSQTSVDAAFNALKTAIPVAIKNIDTATSNIDSTIAALQKIETTNNTVRMQQFNNIINDLTAIQPYLSDEQGQLTNVRTELLNTNSVSKSIADQMNRDSSKIATQVADALRVYHSGVQKDLQAITDNLGVTLKDAGELIDEAQTMSSEMSSMVDTAREGTSLTSKFSGDMYQKLSKFKDVISSLGSKLEQVNNSNIAEIISIMENDPKLMGDYMSEPFDISQESVYPIPNYGSGMAPLYTTLAIWVGCLILNSILRPEVAWFEGVEKLTLRERHFGKMLLFATCAAAQGLIVAIGDLAILKIYVTSAPLFVFFAILSGIVFSIITYTLMSTLGNVGKALSIIYLIVQVAGSGGSYPIQVDPPIFRFMQPLFPFTYTLSGMREAIAGPLVSAVVGDVVGLTVFGMIFLVGGYFTVKPLNDTFHQFELEFKKSGLGE